MTNPNTTAGTDDPFALTDGFESDVVFDDAYFGFNEKYMNGTTPILVLEGDPLDGQGEMRLSFFSFGDAFEVVDNGERIVAKSGDPKKRISGQSSYGKLLASAMEIPELAKVLRERADGAGPTHAAIWKGLAVTLTQKEVERTVRGEKTTGRVTTVTAFHPSASKGLDGGETGNTPAAPQVQIGSWGIDVNLEATLVSLASQTSSQSEFNERALNEVAGVQGNAQAEALVGDPAFYEEIKG